MTAVYCFLSAAEAEKVLPLCHFPLDVRLISLSCEDWNRDLSPWPAARVFLDGADFSGGADAFLQKLTSDILPQKEAVLGISPTRRLLAGYSLAGLFSLYAATECDLFDGIASMSGSLWFDGFLAYLQANPLSKKVKNVYFSLGDKEKNAREPRMKTVEDCTVLAEKTVHIQGKNTLLQMHPGGHFRDVPERIAAGLSWLVAKTEEEHG